MENIMAKLTEILAVYGLNVLGAIATLLIGWMLAKIVRSTLKKVMTRARLDETLISFSSTLVYVGLIMFVVVSALGKLGMNTGSLIAVVGAAGLAVGLALQGSMANFAAGVLMVIFKPFKLGDFIEAGGVAGIVFEIGIFNTIVQTVDNKKIIVPNGAVTGGTITNYSANDTRRIDLVVGVSYQDDLDRVRKVLQQILADEPRILPEPEATIAVLELADSSIDFAFRPWVNTADYWPVYFNLNEQIKKRFDAEGISIPFPQRDVHMVQS